MHQDCGSFPPDHVPDPAVRHRIPGPPVLSADSHPGVRGQHASTGLQSGDDHAATPATGPSHTRHEPVEDALALLESGRSPRHRGANSPRAIEKEVPAALWPSTAGRTHHVGRRRPHVRSHTGCGDKNLTSGRIRCCCRSRIICRTAAELTSRLLSGRQNTQELLAIAVPKLILWAFNR